MYYINEINIYTHVLISRVILIKYKAVVSFSFVIMMEKRVFETLG